MNILTVLKKINSFPEVLDSGARIVLKCCFAVELVFGWTRLHNIGDLYWTRCLGVWWILICKMLIFSAARTNSVLICYFSSTALRLHTFCWKWKLSMWQGPSSLMCRVWNAHAQVFWVSNCQFYSAAYWILYLLYLCRIKAYLNLSQAWLFCCHLLVWQTGMYFMSCLIIYAI